jgi:hypothetical protein
MLARLFAVLALAPLLLSCGTDVEEARVALPGKVTWAAALHPDECDEGVCQATYQVRITNETDTALYVPQCQVLRPPTRATRRLPIMGLDGLEVRAGRTETWIASSRLSATPSEIHRLTGAALRCAATGGLTQQAFADG